MELNMAYDAFKSYFCDLLQTTKPSFYPGFVINLLANLGGQEEAILLSAESFKVHQVNISNCPWNVIISHPLLCEV